VSRPKPRPFPIGDLRRRVARRLMRLLFGPPAQPSSEPLPKTGIHRVLICHISHALGNALLLTPLLQEIEATWPGAEIDIITRSQVGQVLYGHYESVNRVFQLPSHGVGHPRRWLSAVNGMRRSRYDLAIEPDPQSQSGRLLLLLADATWTVGYTGAKKSGSITHPVELPDSMRSNGQRPVYLLRRALGTAASAADYPMPDLRLDAVELARGRHALAHILRNRPASIGRRRTIGIFANATGPKRLGPEWWTPLLDALQAGCPDCDLVEIIPMFGSSLLESRYPAYFSSDLRKLGSVLASLDAYVSLDCGIMHLACASRAPTLAIFTTTNADEWGPYGPGNHVVRAYDLPPELVAGKIVAIVSAADRAVPAASRPR
jgi:heptosyltransferase III